MNKKALITIKHTNDTNKYNVDIIINEEVYRYIEPTDKNTLVEFDKNKCILRREDTDLSMEYFFNIDNTTNSQIYIKELKQFIDISIKTNKIIIEDNKIYINYSIENEIYEYSIEVE